MNERFDLVLVPEAAVRFEQAVAAQTLHMLVRQPRQEFTHLVPPAFLAVLLEETAVSLVRDEAARIQIRVRRMADDPFPARGVEVIDGPVVLADRVDVERGDRPDRALVLLELVD